MPPDATNDRRASRRPRRRGAALAAPISLGATLTPLIDMSFLLVTFFVLVAHVSATERVALRPPSPSNPASVKPAKEARVVLNVLAGVEEAYALGTERFRDDVGGRTALRTRLVELYVANPTVRVNLRADRAARYDRVEPAMRIISAAAATASAQLGTPIEPRMHLVVLREAEGTPRVL